MLLRDDHYYVMVVVVRGVFSLLDGHVNKPGCPSSRYKYLLPDMMYAMEFDRVGSAHSKQ